MTNLSATSSASMGIQRNLQAFDAAARRIASQPLGPDVISDISQMKQAKYGILINVKVMQIANRMNGQLVDLFA